MKITWLGHACFLMETDDIRIITDPYDDTIGYPLPGVSCDLVTTSHNHRDHGAVDRVPGTFKVMTGPVEKFGSLTVRTVETFHDQDKGRKRGKNLVHVFDFQDLKVCHLGDLGHQLDAQQVTAIGPVDILMVPVGGVYTITAAEAVKVVESLNPHITIPMHYKTPYLNFELAPVEDFLQYYNSVVKLPFLEVNKESIGSYPPVVVLDYSPA